jgi:hypothetical protein
MYFRFRGLLVNFTFLFDSFAVGLIGVVSAPMLSKRSRPTMKRTSNRNLFLPQIVVRSNRMSPRHRIRHHRLFCIKTSRKYCQCTMTSSQVPVMRTIISVVAILVLLHVQGSMKSFMPFCSHFLQVVAAVGMGERSRTSCR